MSNIVSFEETMRRRDVDRHSDVILKALNGLHERKSKGIVQPDELSKILVSTGDLYANKVKQGKISEEEIESFITLLPQNNYFVYNHEGLSNAKNTAIESIEMAKEYREERNMNQTVESYTKRRIV